MVEPAKQIILGYRRLSSGEAVQLAVMEVHGIEKILSSDAGFDVYPGITRLS